MPDHQAPFQPAKGAYGKESRQQGNIAQGRPEMVLRPRDAAKLHDPRAGGQTNRAIPNPSGGQAPYGAEMAQQLPVYDEWDDTEFLPLRMRDLPPRPAPPPAAAPPGPQRYAGQAPVAHQQHLPDKVNLPPQNWFPAAVYAGKPAPQIIRTGRETYNIVFTLQKAEPGDGGMSQGVYLVCTKQEKLFVAKRLSTASESERARAMAEMQALQQVKSALRGPHHNVNSMREAFLPENRPQGVLILEYCEAGSLAAGIDALKARNAAISENLAFHFLYGIAKGLAMIHHGVPDHTNMQRRIEKWNTICHLDIKPANILLDRTPIPGKDTATYPRVVIADFGCSVTSSDILNNHESKIVQEFGTPGWYPPEGPAHVSSKDSGRYGKVTDIWQAGGVIQCMCLLLFQPHMGRMEMPVGRKYGPELNCIVAMCMGVDFKRRPTAIDLCRELRAVMVRKGIPV